MQTKNNIEEMIAKIGHSFGFSVKRNVTEYSANIRFKNEYHPKIDLIWYLSLDRSIDFEIVKN